MTSLTSGCPEAFNELLQSFSREPNVVYGFHRCFLRKDTGSAQNDSAAETLHIPWTLLKRQAKLTQFGTKVVRNPLGPELRSAKYAVPLPLHSRGSG